MITIKGLSKQFGDIKALEDINFSVSRGEILALLGPNGAGKTTLIRLLTGLLSPSQGEIYYDDEKLSQNRVAILNHIGYIPENAPLYNDMSVYEFLRFAARLHKMNDRQIAEKQTDLVRTLELQDVINRRIGELSKGYRHRVAIAGATIHSPNILILDEPSEGLDPNQKYALRLFLKRFSTQGIVIMSTHILEDVEAIASRIILLNHGKIIEDSTPFQLRYRMPERDLSTVFRRLTQTKKQ